MTLLQRGATWIGGQLKTAAGVTVAYQRGSRTATLTAAATWFEHRINDIEVEQLVDRVRRYVFVTADLLFGTRAFTPQDGDRITETLNGVACVFEVMPSRLVPSEKLKDQAGILTEVFAARVVRG